jgi:hypothetical protein
MCKLTFFFFFFFPFFPLSFQDEYGRPFIVIREQAQKQRIRGLEAQKVRRRRRRRRRKAKGDTSRRSL